MWQVPDVSSIEPVLRQASLPISVEGELASVSMRCLSFNSRISPVSALSAFYSERFALFVHVLTRSCCIYAKTDSSSSATVSPPW